MSDNGSAARRARLALIIDGDNISPDYMPIILREAASLGTVTIRRLYGHFASPAMSKWHQLVHEYALTPVHVPPAATGKNASDMKMAIETMDLLHRRQLEGFCIASSDSDFTALASRIREEGLPVYGFGAQKASKAYVRSCDRFFFCDLLMEEAQRAEQPPAQKMEKLPLAELFAAVDSVAGEDGWAHLGPVGSALNKLMPEFDSRNYGYKKLSDLLRAVKKLEVRPSGGKGTTTIEVRRK